MIRIFPTGFSNALEGGLAYQAFQIWMNSWHGVAGGILA